MSVMKINCSPVIYCGLLPPEVIYEIFGSDYDMTTNNYIVRLDWDEDEDNDSYPLTKDWLIRTYGEEMRQHFKIVLEIA